MIGASSRRRSNQPRKCIFCGEGGSGNPMSGEHVWSEWMHPYLPEIPHVKKWGVYRRLRGAWEAIIDHQKPQQGHAYTLTIKAVCKRCNETWMSEIEADAKPILVPMLRGLHITLRQPEKIKLARWFALKVMVAEQRQPRDAVVGEVERRAFGTTRVIPDSFQIWIGAHDLDVWYSGYWHQSMTASLTPALPPRRTIQASAIGVGHILSLSVVCTLAGYDISPRMPGKIERLWPVTDDDIRWPLPTLTLHEARDLALILAHVMTAPSAVHMAPPG
jgi:hypothetical protein